LPFISAAGYWKRASGVYKQLDDSFELLQAYHVFWAELQYHDGVWPRRTAVDVAMQIPGGTE
jgi:hypothetical protein